ncbi:cytochrome d ubiquinol oxidase subunit II [Jannaschia sp. LMIT008]|uniref:cytochrome d ubiquinol oxidase subunit II n=1 Tax=Jannaschia maritima TaxID=3032585 RepID=UPI002812636D|nr:cytochrome d ubiquinol oxidase subunit II [Jannaschia sp. LMIT008]
MMHTFGDPAIWLPMAFAVLLGLSILIYVVLDGFDLGVGLLTPFEDGDRRDRMVASIGPFWDANETWLVLAVGILLVAFPVAHGAILTALYLPVAVMLIGLILRGVAFEFRAKAPGHQKARWDRAFFYGSLMTALSQGFMLGLYIMGLRTDGAAVAFAALSALGVTAGYAFIGAVWLVAKTEDGLQERAIRWAKATLWFVAVALIGVSVASPLASERVAERWFAFPEIVALAPLPLMAALLIAGLHYGLRHIPFGCTRADWIPFGLGSALFAVTFAGLAYSFYPYVVPDQLTIYDAASAPGSLWIIFVGTCVVLPIIGGYTVLAYVIFRGKAQDLRYD